MPVDVLISVGPALGVIIIDTRKALVESYDVAKVVFTQKDAEIITLTPSPAFEKLGRRASNKRVKAEKSHLG